VQLDVPLHRPVQLDVPMQLGAHLPLIAFDGERPTLARLRAFAQEAARLDYAYLCANDHLLFGRPWLDGPVALAATIDAAADMTLATTVCLPVIRGAPQTAKALAALDVLAEGRLVAGVGPGSSARDYAAVGVPFAERWQRFDASVKELRALLSADSDLEPHPVSGNGPPLWIASWGSPAGLRRVARLGDGWLASGYNTTPERFADARVALAAHLRDAGRDPGAFPNAIATMWLYVTESRREEERILEQLLAPAIGRTVEELRALPLPIGPAEQCAERLDAYARAGAERVFVWPLADELRQLEHLRERVAPLIGDG
jgi:alkanesulfonate monooxygenase SsuD/methylene tetrahydromethanopterin reductase-like flavin-dependent oxidoreductase (luciferase family)